MRRVLTERGPGDVGLAQQISLRRGDAKPEVEWGPRVSGAEDAESYRRILALKLVRLAH